MARKIRVYGTNVLLCNPMIENARKLGLGKYSLQVRIICGATSMEEANRLCQAEGFYCNVFRPAYTSITGNKKELELAGNGGIFVEIGQAYYPISALKGETKCESL